MTLLLIILGVVIGILIGIPIAIWLIGKAINYAVMKGLGW